MFHQWTSKASALNLTLLFVYVTLPLRCRGNVQYEQTCYFPDQSVAAGYGACNITTNGTQTSASSCCPKGPYSYCTISGLCYMNGLLSRGGCTDRTWTSASCPSLCNNVVKQGFVNLFNCHNGGPSVFQCGTGNGPGDCSVTFTIANQSILLRADQEPGAPNAVNYWDPSATFVNKSAVSSDLATATSTAINASITAPAQDDGGPSVTAVGLGVGLPLGLLLLVSLGIIIWQERRLQQYSKKYPAKVDQADLLRAAQAASSGERTARWESSVWHEGAMPTAHRRAGEAQSESSRNPVSPATAPQSGSLRVPARTRSGSFNGSGSDEVHELYSPVATEPRNAF